MAGNPPTLLHTYGAAGTYPVTIREKATPANTATKQVRVPYTAGLAALAAPEDGVVAAAPEAATAPTTSRKRAK
jgi:hypothetical protein